MSFILNNSMRIVLFIILLFPSSALFTQSGSSQGFRVDLSGGITRSLYNEGSFQFGEYSRSGISGDLRIIYQSENLLGIGIETGYFPLAFIKQDQFTNEFGVSDIRANISAIPIFANFLFDFGNIFFNASTGYYLVSSRIIAFGDKSFSSSFDFGFSLSLGYRKMINKKYGFGAEFKSHHLVDTPQLAFTLQLLFSCNISEL